MRDHLRYSFSLYVMCDFCWGFVEMIRQALLLQSQDIYDESKVLIGLFLLSNVIYMFYIDHS